ncbi:MAG: dolichol kinase [Desulfurococcales archaeon]|nr:dolichol kinase [Desulfurococcales archaeon]
MTGAGLVPSDLGRELMVTLLLGLYALFVVFATKYTYRYFIGKGLPHNVAIYYNRKIIHIMAGGVIALLTPVLYSTPLLPALAALALGGFLYYFHRRGKLLYWFQTRDNMYEVNFTIAWGISLFILWIILGDPRLAVLPALFIAFGDAVTGVVRNYLFARRTKHWLGNVAMALVVVPLGLIYGGLMGGLAGVISSFVERYEFGPIDDNLLIALASSLILLSAGLAS